MVATESSIELENSLLSWISYFIVLVVGALGGVIFELLKPLCKSICIPSLVGMILFGCLARNLLDFGSTELMSRHYPESFADWGRQICLSIILMRGGLELDLKGKGLTVLLLTLVPQMMEACTVALCTRAFFKYPWSICLANGFCIGAVSPAVLVPSVMMLIEQKYGIAKKIPQILLAASSFDDISAITLFSVFSTVAFNVVKAKENGNIEDNNNIRTMIGMSVFYVVTGAIAGAFLGSLMICFNSKKMKQFSEITQMRVKFLVMILMAIFMPILCVITEFQESKFILIITFGYFCNQVWGEDGRPKSQLAFLWTFCQPFVFATVGAAIKFSDIDWGSFRKNIIVVLAGLVIRWLATFASVSISDKKFLFKEKAFFGFAWIPKATVQAAIGGATLNNAIRLKGQVSDQTYLYWIDIGYVLLSMAVIAIIITAPLGAILTNTLGTKWLTKDEDHHEQIKNHMTRSVKIYPNQNMPIDQGNVII